MPGCGKPAEVPDVYTPGCERMRLPGQAIEFGVCGGGRAAGSRLPSLQGVVLTPGWSVQTAPLPKCDLMCALPLAGTAPSWRAPSGGERSAEVAGSRPVVDLAEARPALGAPGDPAHGCSIGSPRLVTRFSAGWLAHSPAGVQGVRLCCAKSCDQQGCTRGQAGRRQSGPCARARAAATVRWPPDRGGGWAGSRGWAVPGTTP